jgi:indoleamine 2,3-dioxygenase
MFPVFSDGFFSVDPTHGFLPIAEPLAQLPESFTSLQKLIDQMPIVKDNGSPGLLAVEGAFEKAVMNLPNYVDLVKSEQDPFVLAALFRAYGFVTSAYTLAPSHHSFLKTGKYGKAHGVLPSNVAQPFAAVAEKLEVYPWIDYHYAYSLGNYQKIDKSKGFEWTNLAMAAKFSGMDDERGFIMLHVDINQYSPDMIGAVHSILAAIDDQESLTKPIDLLAIAMNKMNDRRKLMWEASRWKHYNDFRVFIMGVKGNDDLFPNGLLYEGVWDEPKAYRGQTGAQDNIIPTADIVSGVIHYYPQNQLTSYLMDLRQYRPMCIQNFFKELANQMSQKPLAKRLIAADNQLGMQALMSVYEEIYLFRNGHWQFVQKYIMQNTAYPKATGGTPITSWIPNQIKAVLSAMRDLSSAMRTTPNFSMEQWQEEYDRKVKLLNKQLEIVAVEAFDPEAVFKLNLELGYQDF